MMEEKKSFRPDGTVEQQPSTPDNQSGGQSHTPEAEIVDKKDERESYEDYNGNSEANAPARAREGEGSDEGEGLG